MKNVNNNKTIRMNSTRQSAENRGG